MPLIPSKKQYKSWSLPSKYALIGLLIGIVALILTIAGIIFQSNIKNNADIEKQNEESGFNNSELGVEDSIKVDSRPILNNLNKINEQISLGNDVRISFDHFTLDEESMSPINYKDHDLYINSTKDLFGTRLYALYHSQFDSISKLVYEGGVFPLYFDVPSVLPAYMVFYIQNISGNQSPAVTIKEVYFVNSINYINKKKDSVITALHYLPHYFTETVEELTGKITIKKNTRLSYLKYDKAQKYGSDRSRLIRIPISHGQEKLFAIELDSEYYGNYYVTLHLNIVYQYTNSTETVRDTMKFENFAKFNVLKPSEIIDETTLEEMYDKYEQTLSEQ